MSFIHGSGSGGLHGAEGDVTADVLAASLLRHARSVSGVQVPVLAEASAVGVRVAVLGARGSAAVVQAGVRLLEHLSAGRAVGVAELALGLGVDGHDQEGGDGDGEEGEGLHGDELE